MTAHGRRNRDTQQTNVLDQAVERVREHDAALADTLRREVTSLRGRRRFGLVFDRHQPELVRLPEHPVTPRSRVRLRRPSEEEPKDQSWEVRELSYDGDQLMAIARNAAGELQRPVQDFVVVHESGEPFYPGLVSAGRIDNGEPEQPWHCVIRGENLHALHALTLTHRESVDLLYIDPPYNTGNRTWAYNDDYVAKEDPYKHSKWLSFMERRLRPARELLKDTGVIIVAIGDDEHHRLRMLLDDIFGPQNFISNVVWQGGRKNDPRFVSNAADYMLVYAKSQETLIEQDVRWRAEKVGLRTAQDQARRLLDEHDGDADAATRAYRQWVKGFSREDMPPSVARYNKIEPETARLHRTDLDLSWPGGGGPRYEVVHPLTGKPCRIPSRGWIYSTSARFQEEVDAGRIVFGPDETKVPSRLSYLDELENDTAVSVFESPRSRGPKHLETKAGVFGEKRFPNPKDHEVLMRWIRLAAPQDAVVLDFFGGSGSTTEAVLRLNAEDGGTRQSILVTNNELPAAEAAKLSKAGHHSGDAEWEAAGVFENVTLPRLSTVVTGLRPDGSKYSEGLVANVEFLHVTYLQRGRVHRHREFAAVAPLLWMWAGARGPRLDEQPPEGWRITDTYGVLFDVDSTEQFLAALNARDREGAPELRKLFVHTDSSSQFAALTERMPHGRRRRTHQLYSTYLRHFDGLDH